MEYIPLIVTMEIKPIFQCQCCHKTALGATVEVTRYSISDLEQYLDRKRLDPNTMPVGWSNSYYKGFRCNNCS